MDIVHNQKMRDDDDRIFGSTKLGHLHKDSDQGWMENSHFGTNQLSVVITRSIEIPIQSGEKTKPPSIFAKSPTYSASTNRVI